MSNGITHLMSPALMTRRLEQFPLTGPDGGQIFTEIQGRGNMTHGSAISPNQIEDLISSIGTGGLLSPILLEAISSTSFRVVSGERRLRAMRWGAQNHPENPHFQQLAAVVVDGPLSEQDRRRFQLVENLAREDLQPGELAAALLYERSAVLSARLLLEGVDIDGPMTEEDPVARWNALDKARTSAGLHNTGAPWEDVLNLLGISMSPAKAKKLVRAFRAMPSDVAAEMDDVGISLASRQSWLQLGSKGRDGAANKIWEAIKTAGRPELLTRACHEAIDHPSADVDEVMDLAATIHDRVGLEDDEIDTDAEISEGEVVALGMGVELEQEVIIATESLRQLADLARDLRAGKKLQPYDAGSLRLRVKELTDLLDGIDVEATESEAEAA